MGSTVSDRMIALRAALALALAASACGPAPVDNSQGRPAKSVDPPSAPPGIVENSAPVTSSLPDTELRPARAALVRALEGGDLDQAEMLLRKLETTTPDTRLFRARFLCRRGQDVQALRELEAARRDATTPAALGAVHATAAELYCALGRTDAAADEIRGGLAACGETPELLRAQGVHALSRPGGARVGLARLERARELDPELAFLVRPLAEAHLLVGRTELREERPLEAVRAARAGLELFPEDRDLLQLHADGLLATGALRSAVAVFEELLATGEGVENELAMACWRAGMGELVQSRRPEAVELFARARSLGMQAESLGSAARILSEESTALVERGALRYREDRLDEARGLFAEALYLDPENLAAENHLALVHFRLGAHELAVEGWERVLTTFDELGRRPPEPVHLNAALAWLELGQPDPARRRILHYGDLEQPLETEADLRRAIDLRRETWTVEVSAAVGE